MSAFIFETYPEDEENGILQTTTEELAQHGASAPARVDGVAAGRGALMAHPPVDGFNVLEVKRMLVLLESRYMDFAAGAEQARADRPTATGAETDPDAAATTECAAARRVLDGYVRRSAYGDNINTVSTFFEKTCTTRTKPLTRSTAVRREEVFV